MSGRITVFLIVLMFSLGPLAQVGGSGGQDGDRGMGPFEESSVWTDSFDDLSHVYVPPGGLIGVEVIGGQAQLKAGDTDGWIASSIISARPGMKYDYVFIDALTPGDSYINITVLNASAESLEVGYANKTIDNFVLREGPFLSMTSLSWRVYPDIRIQANLVADGTDRPELYAWSVHFLDVEAWQDDFLWSGRMSDHRGLNFTNGNLEVNLTSMGGTGGGDYEAYPPIVASGEYGGPDVFYVNAAGDGYNDRIEIGMGGWASGLALDDLNNDGYFDLLFQMWVNRLEILWGDTSGTWSSSRTTILNAPFGPEETATGDFNGDGWFDIVVAQSGSSIIYMNQGDGSFVDSADFTMSMGASRVSTGDLDGDGYYDILFTDLDVAKVFMGGASGPSTTAAITFSTSNCGDTLIQDVDGDGHLDVVMGERNGGKTNVYLGGRDGPDTTADYSLSIPDAVGACEAGDVNGDGHTDLLFYSGSGSSYRLYIFEGNSQGWSDSRRHADITHNDNGNALFTADLDKDGFEDILQVQSVSSNYRLKVWYGDTTWPSTPDIVKESGYDNSVVVAMPKDSGGTRAYRGTFITEPISLAATVNKKWDMLDLTGSMPINTTMTLSVLEAASGDPITGYEDLTEWNVDLAGIDPDMYRTIQVEVTITSEFNWTTPVLDRILVKWMDRRVWRDEFYGAGKVDRALGLEVAGGDLGAASLGGVGPQLIFPSIMGDDNYTTSPRAFLDAGGLDYLSGAPIEFIGRGTSAVDVGDVNDDGYVDVIFAVHRIATTAFGGKSPLFLGSPMGLRVQPVRTFDTTGAMDVLLRDLDDDGYLDVVFAQEQRAVEDYSVNSSLYWGSADGWADTPDVDFVTSGASGVEAVDLDGDGLQDLVFACFRGTETTVDSLVFMQGATGFNGTTPSHRLATDGARAVASGDLDGDTFVDLVFANNFQAGFTEIDSFIYWGKAGGGFDATTTDLPTKGAMDVKVADLDGDDDLDIVFANHENNNLDPVVDSVVYLNDGSGGFGTGPDVTLPTSGATGVAVADLDGTGWLDLLFSCEQNASTYQVPSVGYLGGNSGWQGTPDIFVPTEGASDVIVARLLEHGSGGYLSVPIVLDDPPRDTGTVHTFRYNATMGPSITGTLRLVDKETWEELAETQLQSGTNEWDVRELFSVRKHPVVRLMVVLSGLESRETITMDDLWLNWTQRVRSPPEVLDMGLSNSTVLRLQGVEMWVNATDGYDLPGDLTIYIHHRLNGTDEWDDHMVGRLTFDEASGSWRTTLATKTTTPLGRYDLRVIAEDRDVQYSEAGVYPMALEVLNNIPTAPRVMISPEHAVSTSVLHVEILEGARDVESGGLTYIYRWYRDGVSFPNETTDNLIAYYTSKGENWSVEVVAFDGDDEGPPGLAWVVINNAPPFPKYELPDPQFDEDTTDQDWLDLSGAFEDPDGDDIEWSIAEESENLTLTIDPVTGKVTIEPAADWFGEETITFVASDGEFTASQTVTVIVTSVNDIPWIVTVDGLPPTSDPMVYAVNLGEVLTIIFTVDDIEGDEVRASLNITTVDLDEDARTITFEPGTEAVGTFRFALRIWDVVSPTTRPTLNFTIQVVNENDPMEEPKITQPAVGEKFKVNQSFSLVAECDDPDIPFGQKLEFIWTSDIEGELGRGASIVVTLKEEGTHTITVTVRDPDFEKRTDITVVIEPQEDVTPPPPPNGNGVGTGTNWAVIAVIIVVLVIVGVVVIMVVGKRTTERYEAKMDDEEEAEEKRVALERTAQAIKDVADEWESELEGAKAQQATKAAAIAEGWEMEEIEVESTAGQLSMEAKVTEAPTGDVQKLWAGVSEPGTERSPEEMEALRVENLKRKYQNTIGRLPYGIPSKELADRDWVELASALVTGEKRTLPDGRETTNIEGRWYYSDPDDTGSFLKEHGAKPKPQAPKAAATEKDKLFAKLEERFIMGEISEETYKSL
ncbi:MAG: VCBS repeat-containing protein, partial [Thermoplasmata archaeon]|nr:VCBS repeat-containing protein [Thermoplasmata archaeon]